MAAVPGFNLFNFYKLPRNGHDMPISYFSVARLPNYGAIATWAAPHVMCTGSEYLRGRQRCVLVERRRCGLVSDAEVVAWPSSFCRHI